MTKRIICLLAALSAIPAPSCYAQGEAPGPAGTLTLKDKTYTFKRAMAYETKIDDEDAITVVLSGQPVTSEILEKAREEEKGGSSPEFQKPFLRLVFNKAGELQYWSALAGGTTIGRHTGEAKGQVKVEGDRVKGQASQPLETEGMFPSGLEAHFDVALLKAGQSLPASTVKKYGPAANVKPTVTGTFRGNGKEAKLAFVTARWVEPFNDKTGIELTFTEKDQSKDKNPGFNAGFGKLGSALIISLHEDGQIYGCQVVHTAHQKQGFSSTGQIEANDFSYGDGKVEGEITTNGELDAFGEKWEVKIKFVAPLGEIPKKFQVAKSETKPVAPAKEEEEDEAGAVPSSDVAVGGESAGTGPKAKELALTKDATGVEYNGMMEQLGFKSKSSVKSVCGELAAGLKAQGWKTEGMDMVNPQSSILRRKQGAATLTIFVKPDGAGSEVKMMTEGLGWE